MARRPRKKVKVKAHVRKVSPLYDPAQMLAGPTLRKAAQQITNATTQPTVSAYNHQIADTQRQGAAVNANAGDYYRQLAQNAMQGVARQKGIGDLLNSKTQEIGGRAFRAQQGHNDDQLRFLAMDQGVRGQGLDGNQAPLVAAENQAHDVLASGQLSGEQSAASQGANWQALANVAGMATGMRGGEQQQQLANRTLNTVTDARQKLADFRVQHAGDYATNLQKLRQQSFENQAVLQGAHIKLAGIQQTAADKAQARADARAAKRSANRLAARRIDATLSGQNLSHADRIRQQDLSHQDRVTQQAISAAKTGTGAGGKPLTTLQRRTARATAAKAWGTVNNTLGLMDPSTARVDIVDSKGKATGKTRPATMHETVAGLRGKKVPEWAIQASLSIRHHGFILPSVLKDIKAQNPYIKIPARYLPKNRGVAAYNGPH
jgi:hypothetical protein